jgi:hypothetical protein
MVAQLEKLQAQIRAEPLNRFVNTNLSFGAPIASDLTEKDVAGGRAVLYFPKLMTDSEQMTWQGSPLISLSGSITSYHTTDKKAVEHSHSLLAFLGYKRESGDVGRPPRMPYAVNNGALIILAIECPEGVVCAAANVGTNVWAVEQPVEIHFVAP